MTKRSRLGFESFLKGVLDGPYSDRVTDCAKWLSTTNSWISLWGGRIRSFQQTHNHPLDMPVLNQMLSKTERDPRKKEFTLAHIIRDYSGSPIDLIYAWHAYVRELGKVECVEKRCNKTFYPHDGKINYCCPECRARAYGGKHYLLYRHGIPARSLSEQPKIINAQGLGFKEWIIQLKKYLWPDNRRDTLGVVNQSIYGPHYQDFASHIALDVERGDDFPTGHVSLPALCDYYRNLSAVEGLYHCLVDAWCEYASQLPSRQCKNPRCDDVFVNGTDQVKYCSEECRDENMKRINKETARLKSRAKLNAQRNRFLRRAEEKIERGNLEITGDEE